MTRISKRIADELGVKSAQVDAAIRLLDEGATVPFIARYRKEITGALDDSQLRHLEERLQYCRELDDRRASILKSIAEQDKLSPELEKRIQAADTKSDLEDLYLPYKPKRRTKGQIAREAGLEPLADALFQQPDLDPTQEASAYLDPAHQITDPESALEGAKYILIERFNEDADLLGKLKRYMWEYGDLKSEVVAAQEKQASKFKDYFDYHEAISKIPSHRALALFRGRNEGMLNVRLVARDHDPDDRLSRHPCENIIARHYNWENQNRPADNWLGQVIRWAWRVKMSLHIENELLSQLREQAERVAIDVFAQNLKDLLLAAPAGAKTTMGLDPGLRTGVKVAVVDSTGKYLANTTIYPHAPQNKWDAAIATLAKLAQAHNVDLVGIGNGTASRETDKLVADLMKKHPELKLPRAVVSEAGASVYSASAYAAEEFPDLDVTIRGAVSIARRLQDPLAELVKIEPKSIGVGQYQHDVSQVQLNRSLINVVEDCVNAVGVEVNTASAPLLTRVSGLNQSIARQIVAHRDANGPFKKRTELKKVSRLGQKAFEQCAGFLRIRDGDNPLDASAVHPESYPVVERIADKSQCALSALVGHADRLKSVNAKEFVNEDVGLLTVEDILNELAKPGRDPRPEFKSANFRDGVESIADLQPDMVLEGTVTNVTHFGAFVDIGVHQDGLVHISLLADRFVKDPRDVVKAGDVVKVKVMEVDVQRKRIGLSMRLNESSKTTPGDSEKPDAHRPKNQRQQRPQPSQNGAMAAAFSKAATSKSH